MSAQTTSHWDSKRTNKTRHIEDLLRNHFDKADAYRYNSASIRIRVIDKSFEGISRDERDSRVEMFIDKLPPETQRDIVTLFTFAPSELLGMQNSFREFMQNSEFEDPSLSML